MKERVQKWEEVITRDETTQALAEQTREFWVESSAKMTVSDV